ncbi:MAG TPA: pitrilysin family protein [Candidatus Solibacter sp.]|nr:pitrilysin family protein [Candidatus Solibacter sp.]
MRSILRHARWAAAAFLLCAAAPRPAAGQASPQEASATVRPRPLRIVSRTLPNGLRILIVEEHSTPILNLQVWYHVGSKDERAGRTGFAHLFEHLMFKGSAHVAPDEHSRVIEAAGGVDNAYTNDDVTVFWETVPSNFLERVLWLEADRMASLAVDQANFASEREVVKEERRMRVEDPPYGRLFEDLYSAAFSVHPYRHITIGSMADLDQAALPDVLEFYRLFYRPDNATMIVVGDVVPDECFAWAEKYFGGIPKPAAAVPRQQLVEPPQTGPKQLTRTYGANSPLPAVVEGYKMPPAFAPDFYTLNLASSILSSGESSRLFRRLVYESQLAAQAAGIGNFTEDPNLFLAFAVMNQGKTAEEGKAAIESVLDQMKDQPVSEHELNKAKNQVLAASIFAREGDQQTGDTLGFAAVIGKDPELVNRESGLYLAVTPADIQRAAREYFVPARSTVMFITAPPAPR